MEVTAHTGEYWGRRWETNIVRPVAYGRILSYAAKWLNGRVFVRGWIDFKRNKEYRLIKELWKLLDEADIIIGQNNKAFDNKWINAAFLRYGLPPPSPYKTIDTKTEAKKYLYLPSYALNDMADYFGLGHKVEHEGFGLWLKCIEGNKAAWAKMKKYNANDVLLTEKLYLLLRPFIQNHPQVLGKCPRCGSDKLISRGKLEYPNIAYKRLSCGSCGGWIKGEILKNKVLKPI